MKFLWKTATIDRGQRKLSADWQLAVDAAARVCCALVSAVPYPVAVASKVLPDSLELIVFLPYYTKHVWAPLFMNGLSFSISAAQIKSYI